MSNLIFLFLGIILTVQAIIDAAFEDNLASFENTLTKPEKEFNVDLLLLVR